MEYYSRKNKDSDKKELLRDHLRQVGELAKEYADAWGEGTVGHILGLFHDAGKVSKLFQDVLDGNACHVNHECAGAFLLKFKLKNIDLARVVYAHHKGLMWNINDDIEGSYTCKRSIESRETNRRFSVQGPEEYKLVFNYAKSVLSEVKIEKPVFLPEFVSEKYPSLPEMLHHRMLLSCLCDADYTAAASYSDNTILERSEETVLDAKLILDTLIKHKEAISSSSDSDLELNKIRNEIFDLCIAAGSKNESFYTLTAPTGTGKTFSLLAFALSHAKERKKKRIIIVLPYLSIINQNAKIYRDICKKAGLDCVLETHSFAIHSENELLDSERWNSPIIITTSVKFFEALFKSKPTDLRFLHSIADSVIVFDEAQSVPTDLLGTTMESVNALIKMFRCTVLFSTATQPNFEMRSDLKNIYDIARKNEIIPNPQIIYKALERVNIEWRINSDEHISFENIAEEMSECKNAACVVNLKDHAHKLYNILSGYIDDESLFFISTDMCKVHRDEVIKEIFYRQKNDLPCLLVSTSCIEAGVDFDFEFMFRALAPLDSIVQCAGRCNRNGKNIGKMVVFIPEEDKLYPSDTYENAAHIVQLINSRHPVDINDPEHIKEYYNELFRIYPSDKKKLTDAIEQHDFDETEKQYRFIDNTGVNVLVPYSGRIELYEKLRSAATGKNIINAEWIREAAVITVNSYKKDLLDDHCIHPYISVKGGEFQQAKDWYILEDTDLYSDKTGLTFDEETEQTIMI